VKLPIPNDWDNTSWCDYAICWPDSEMWGAILRGFITLPQRGWTWDERTGSVLDVQEIGRQITDINLDLRSCIMACDNQEIANALLAIAAALETNNTGQGSGTSGQSSGCCEDNIISDGGGIQIIIEQPGSEVPTPGYGTQPPIGVPRGTVPDGFANEAEYLTDKCEMANLIVSNWILTLRELQGISFFNAAAVVALIAASIVGVIVFPPSLLPIMAAAVIVMAGSMQLLDLAADYIDANRGDFVCAMYDSADTEGALALLADLIDVLISALAVTGPIGIAIKTILLLLVNTDTLNQLFKKVAHNVFPEADCSGCTSEIDCFDFELEQSLLGWEVIDQAGGTVGISAVLQGMEVVTGAPSDTQHTIFGVLGVNYTIQPGDEFIILYTADPVAYGRTLWLTLDGVRTTIINEGSIVDHLLCAPVDLTPYAGALVTAIEISINRFGGGTWVIRRAGFNCLCT